MTLSFLPLIGFYGCPRLACDREEPLGIKGEEDKEEYKKIFANPVVFAVCVVEAGRKVLDYYMTWRGKTVRVFIFLSCSIG